ncbi:MAG: carbohydrate porin [Fidelibacterota bacterium]
MATHDKILYRILFLIVFVITNNIATGTSTGETCDGNINILSDSPDAVILAQEQEEKETTNTRKRKCRYNQKTNGENQRNRGLRPRSRKRRVEALIQKGAGDEGLQFNGGATSVLQGSQGGNQSYSTTTASFDIYAQAMLDENTIFFIDLEAVGGNGADKYFPNYAGMNGDAGSTQDEGGTDRLTVLEVWAEMKMLNERVAVTAGKIDMTNYFDINDVANDETTQFISGAFINSSAFAMPENSPGIRFHTCVTEIFYLQFGLASADNSGDKIFDDLYKIAGMNYRLLPGTVFDANFRLYGYQHPLADNAMGWGISFDKQIISDHRIFARYGNNQNQLVGFWNVKTAWSTGLKAKGMFLNKPLEAGIAYGASQADQSVNKNEQLLEIYFRHQINEKISLSTHFQHIWNRFGDDENVAAAGIRTHFNF